MYTDIGNGYQYHLPTEEDRQWLEECLVDNPYWTVDTIFNAATPDETSSRFEISRIISLNNENLCVVLHEVMKAQTVLANYGIVVHPLHRNQGEGHEITKQLLRWDRDVNKWGLSNIYFIFENTWDTSFLGENWDSYPNDPFTVCFCKISDITL